MICATTISHVGSFISFYILLQYFATLSIIVLIDSRLHQPIKLFTNWFHIYNTSNWTAYKYSVSLSAMVDSRRLRIRIVKGTPITLQFSTPLFITLFSPSLHLNSPRLPQSRQRCAAARVSSTARSCTWSASSRTPSARARRRTRWLTSRCACASRCSHSSPRRAKMRSRCSAYSCALPSRASGWCRSAEVGSSTSRRCRVHFGNTLTCPATAGIAIVSLPNLPSHTVVYVVVKIAPIGTPTRICHSRVRRSAGLTIPGRDIDFMSCSVFTCALSSLYYPY